MAVLISLQEALVADNLEDELHPVIKVDGVVTTKLEHFLANMCIAVFTRRLAVFLEDGAGDCNVQYLEKLLEQQEDLDDTMVGDVVPHWILSAAGDVGCRPFEDPLRCWELMCLFQTVQAMFIRTITAGRSDFDQSIQALHNLDEHQDLLKTAAALRLLFVMAYEPAVLAFTRRDEYLECRAVYLALVKDACKRKRRRGMHRLVMYKDALEVNAQEASKRRFDSKGKSKEAKTLEESMSKVDELRRMPAFVHKRRLSSEKLVDSVSTSKSSTVDCCDLL